MPSLDPTILERARADAHRMADAVIAARDAALQTRAVVLAASLPAPLAAAAAEGVVAPPARAGSSAGLLVAEGDSWFDYPWTDVVRVLEDEHGYDVDSVAHKGDTVEGMAYEGGQLEELTRTLERALRRGTPPRAILLSAGGNDVAGNEFAVLLNHAASAAPGLNEDVVRGVIDVRLRLAYVRILASVTQICVNRIGTPIPILLHGYAYPVPDGRGFMGGWWVLPGPWLEPGFRAKGYRDMKRRKELLRALIDRFNAMLADVAAMEGFGHVRHLDLRDLFQAGNYKTWWANELHPTADGFREVAKRFAAAL